MLKSDLPRLTPADYGDANSLRTEVYEALAYASLYPNSRAAIKAFFDGVAAMIDATPAAPPANTTAPAITGTAQVGQVLTASTGTWTGSPAPTYTYAWAVGGTTVAGQTASTYTPVAGDVGKTVVVTVTAHNSAGTASKASAATAAVVA